MVSTNGQRRRGGLLGRVTCPHCWEHFRAEKVLWILSTRLLGDQRLGPEQPQRFLRRGSTSPAKPSMPKASPASSLPAALSPGCAASLLELEPLFLSVFGAPASANRSSGGDDMGACAASCRSISPSHFPTRSPLNRVLNEYEESLFSSVGRRIRSARETDSQDRRAGGACTTWCPYGSQAVISASLRIWNAAKNGSPERGQASTLSRVVCLYDNAGESFQPGKDTTATR